MYPCHRRTIIRPTNDLVLVERLHEIISTLAHHCFNMLGQKRGTLHLYIVPVLSSKRWANKGCISKGCIDVVSYRFRSKKWPFCLKVLLPLHSWNIADTAYNTRQLINCNKNFTNTKSNYLI